MQPVYVVTVYMRLPMEKQFKLQRLSGIPLTETTKRIYVGDTQRLP